VAASPTAIVVGELESTAFNSDVEYYIDGDQDAAWVMKPSTYSAIKSIQGDSRLYGDWSGGKRSLLEYPTYLSNKAGAMTAGLKPVFFGNWSLVGYRESPGLTLLRDPYTNASTGKVNIILHFQTVFKVLQPAAVGYLQMAAS
jgi:HK97 family phage major capsid protein